MPMPISNLPAFTPSTALPIITSTSSLISHQPLCTRRPRRPTAMSSTPATPASTPATPSPSNLLAFYRLVGQLKTTKRAGWVRRHVVAPESIADHMYRMSLMALTLPDVPDRPHLVKLALAHDLAEAIVGDITPIDPVSPQQKHKLEHDAMQRIRDVELNGSPLGHELFDLWTEYEAAQTPAARIVKQLDKLELLVQADEYERQQNIDLSEFFERALKNEGLFYTPALKDVSTTLLAERHARRTNQ